MLKLSAIFLVSLSLLLSQDVSVGYTLYTPGGQGGGGSATTYLKDENWSTVNSWNHDCGPASMPYLVLGDEPGFENTLLYYPCKSSNPTMEAGGVGGQVKIYNWDGDLLWSYALSNNDYQHHHDIAVLPNGNFIVVAWERFYASEWTQFGRSSVNNNLNQFWGTAFLEIEPDLSTPFEFDIVWEWHVTDHLVQDRGSQYTPTYGNISDHPELMDVNCGNVGSNGGPGGQANGDWMHVNAIDYNAELDQIVFSSRHQSEIYIIDHSTTTAEAASHSGGNQGMGGDFIYRWGNPSNYDSGSNSYNILNDQHGVNWIPSWYPEEAGAGNLILYNNFHNNNSSAALEIVTPLNSDGSYNMLSGDVYGPSSYTWIHTGGFFSPVQSGAFRMPNGNTVISVAEDATIFEVDQSGEEVFSYTYPGNAMIARAQKYPPEFFDGIQGGGVTGDINDDDIVNILDIILLVNVVLGLSDSTSSCDINEDGILNILDIVGLVNIVLGT